MLLTYKDHTIVHNATQLKAQNHSDTAGGVCNPTQPEWNHSSQLSHWIMSSYTSGMSQSQYNSICTYGKHMVFQVSLLFKAVHYVLAHFLLLEFCVTQVVSSCSMVGKCYCENPTIFYTLLQLDCWNIDLEELVAILFILLLCDVCLVNLCELQLK